MRVRSYKFFVIGGLRTFGGLVEVGCGSSAFVLIEFASVGEPGNKLVEVYGPNLLLFQLRTSIHLIITDQKVA